MATYVAALSLGVAALCRHRARRDADRFNIPRERAWAEQKYFQLRLNLCLRTLQGSDYDKGMIELLGQLTEVGSVSKSFFKRRLDVLDSDPLQTIVVIEDLKLNKICACGTICVEPKFIHCAGFAGHIEDVVVDRNLRSRGLGSQMVKKLVSIARSQGCYKVILDCKEENVPFYESVGFSRKEVQMASYFPKTQTASEAVLANYMSEEAVVGEGLVIRQLRDSDYQSGFLALLQQLTTVGDVPISFFQKRLQMLKNSNRELMYVVEDTSSGRIVAAGSLLVEYKFIHSAGKCGHIEDVVVDKHIRGRGLGKIIVRKLRQAAQMLGCYKCILDCGEQNVRFYEKCGFKKKEICMAMYL